MSALGALRCVPMTGDGLVDLFDRWAAPFKKDPRDLSERVRALTIATNEIDSAAAQQIAAGKGELGASLAMLGPAVLQRRARGAGIQHLPTILQDIAEHLPEDRNGLKIPTGGAPLRVETWPSRPGAFLVNGRAWDAEHARAFSGVEVMTDTDRELLLDNLGRLVFAAAKSVEDDANPAIRTAAFDVLLALTPRARAHGHLMAGFPVIPTGETKHTELIREINAVATGRVDPDVWDALHKVGAMAAQNFALAQQAVEVLEAVLIREQPMGSTLNVGGVIYGVAVVKDAPRLVCNDYPVLESVSRARHLAQTVTLMGTLLDRAWKPPFEYRPVVPEPRTPDVLDGLG